MTRDKLILACIILAVCLLGSAKATETKILLDSEVVTDGDFITLPVEIDGKQYAFMVDTGSRTTLLDATFQDDLVVIDDTEKPREIRDGFRSKRYRAPSMTIIGTKEGRLPLLKEAPVWCMDLSSVRATTTQEIYGVIGMDFLSQYALELDLATGSLRLLESQSLDVVQHDGFLNIEMIEQRPYVLVRSFDVKSLALIDTGALLTLDIDSDAYEFLIGKSQLKPWFFDIDVDGIKQTQWSLEGWLKELKVGPFTHHLVAVRSADGTSLLGLNYWKRYHVTFDFPRKLVYLDKGPHFDMFDESGHSGIFVTTAEGNTKAKVVTHIMKGCQAEQNGVQVGDQIIAINGKGVEDSLVQDIYRRLSARADRECILKLLRNGKEFTVTLPEVGKMPLPND